MERRDYEVVISGISGRFPESDSISEFSENLFNKVDLLTEDNRRWEPGLYGVPKKMGQLKDIRKFDSQFFGVNPKQAHLLDPQARILLELTHESIVDAGYDPEELRGRKIGVFIGNCYSESDEFFCQDPDQVIGYTMTGCWRSMFANRISYTFDFKGPSFALDSACSSGSSVLYEGVRAIQNNECEAAIVGVANLCLRPTTTLGLYRLHALSDDGICKSFDAAANGYSRSEAVVALLLQKYDVARRKYATIVHIKTNTDGFKETGITSPSAVMQKQLMEEVYEECKLNPLNVSLFEAHGTGTSVGDPIEMSAISDIFCRGRKEPLLVGSVKSNMGHAESASGLCSVAKILIGMEKSLIPPNIHFKNPNPNIKSLIDGQVKIVTDATPWDGEYAAINNFGIGGVNAHIVLKSNTHKQLITQVQDMHIPQLALYNGRTEESVQYLFDYLHNEMPPKEFFSLLHKSAYGAPSGKPYRGYKLVVKDQEISEIKKVTTGDRPVWYVFSGTGSQWPGMAKQLMNLEVFANSIRRSAQVLKPYCLDLIDLVTNGVNESFSRLITPTFVSIVTIQVALVDVLNEIGIAPDGIIGHSVGELSCAYADGSLTAEQTVLAAYWRGKVIEDANLDLGAMAAVGLTWSEAKKRCPIDIFPACHNAEDNVTVSGPADSVKSFVDVLKSENIFAREVDSCGNAFHTQYMFPAAKKLQTALEKLISNPQPRTNRWISSSYTEQESNDPSVNFSDASYFVHNFISPVLFHDAQLHVPKNAVVIEISPHHLLQAILKRVIGPEAVYVGLMKKNVDNAVHLLSSLGRLYTVGLNPNIEKLYPPVLFPVPKGTPMISPLIKWDHTENWRVAKWETNTKQSRMITEVDISSEESADQYILDYNIDGKCLYPATGYLVLAWKGLAEIKGKDIKALPVTFEEVKFHRHIEISKSAPTKFLVEILSSKGEFEISEGGITVCSGRIYSQENENHESSELLQSNNFKSLPLNSNDIYKELKRRGYVYGPKFQGLAGSDIEGNKGLLKGTEDWLLFLDTMLQFSALGLPKRALRIPSEIQCIKINPILHKSVVNNALTEYSGVPVFHDRITKKVTSGGVELKYLKSSFIAKKPSKQAPELKIHRFVPYNETKIISISEEETLNTYIHVCSSLAKKISDMSENNKDKVNGILNNFKEVDDLLIINYLKSNSDNYILLKSLLSIMDTINNKDWVQHVKHNVTNYLLEMHNDLLSQTMLKEDCLQPVIDIVLENTPFRKLNVAEIVDTQLPLSIKINQFVQTLDVKDVNYLIAQSKPDLLDKNLFPEGTIELSTQDPKSNLTFKDVDLFAMKFLNYPIEEYRQILENVLATLAETGFILVLQKTRLVPAEKCLSAIGEIKIPIHTEGDLEEMFKDLNLQVICKKSDSLTTTMYLLRKSASLSNKDIYLPPIVIPIVDEYKQWVDELREQMTVASMTSDIKRIWLVSEDDNISGILGLVTCLLREPGGSSIRCVFISKKTPNLPKFSLENQFYQDIILKDLTMNVFNEGSWGSYRYLTMPEDHMNVETKHAYLDILTLDNLSSFVWKDSPLKYFNQSDDSVLCQVYYASMNINNILLRNGSLSTEADLVPQYCTSGISEFSGRLENGKRVMGLVPAQSVATTVVADPNFVWEVPDDWSLKEASTVSVAYSTAYFALIVKGNLRKGESILIHSGGSDVGQAAIAIALSLGCEVFTTVDSCKKREFLKKQFNELEDRIFCISKDALFEQHILTVTDGDGVDVILNTFDEDFSVILNCLAKYGRFLQICKYNSSSNIQKGMATSLEKNSFHGIVLDALFEDKRKNCRDKKEVLQLLKDGISNGTVKPLNLTLFQRDEAEQAFKLMINDKNIGKVVLQIREEEPQRHIVPTSVLFKAMHHTICNPEKSYIIIGGLGGFGLELCQWLVEKGARYIVLTSRSGIKTGYQKLCVNRWRQNKINVIISKLDAVKADESKALLKMSEEIKPVSGIFHLALVLRDGFMENQTVEKFKEVYETKVTSTLNLDAASREICPELEWFVCFSSGSCGRGNVGQSNYGYANSVMERMCEKRRKEGLPGLAIQWGAIGDVGITHELIGPDAVLSGTIPQGIDSCLIVMEKILHQKEPVIFSFVPYVRSESSSQKTSKHNVLAAVGNIFGIKDMHAINPETSLGELGMDSLVGVEMRQFLQRELNLLIQISELRQLTIKDLMGFEDAGDKTKATTTPELKSKINTDLTTELDAKVSEEIPEKTKLMQTKEIIPTESIIKMNSITSGIPLFIIHPIEGTVERLFSLANRINVPVYGIQCTPDASSESIEQLASWYWKLLMELNVGNTICLAGYLFGVSVAFEMCLLAQQNNQPFKKILNLIMLDGLPACIQENKIFIQNNSNAEEELQALSLFISQFAKINVTEFRKELMTLPSLADRVEKSVEKISTIYHNFQTSDLTLAFDLYHRKLLMSSKYAPKQKLHKEVILIKSSDSFDATTNSSKTCNLDKICDEKISVHNIKGSHDDFILERGAKEVSNIINKLFSQ